MPMLETIQVVLAAVKDALQLSGNVGDIWKSSKKSEIAHNLYHLYGIGIDILVSGEVLIQHLEGLSALTKSDLIKLGNRETRNEVMNRRENRVRWIMRSDSDYVYISLTDLIETQIQNISEALYYIEDMDGFLARIDPEFSKKMRIIGSYKHFRMLELRKMGKELALGADKNGLIKKNDMDISRGDHNYQITNELVSYIRDYVKRNDLRKPLVEIEGSLEGLRANLEKSFTLADLIAGTPRRSMFFGKRRRKRHSGDSD